MKKWFKRITAGAVAAVVFGMALMPQGESRAAAARIQVSVPENRVPAYEQGETKTFVLEVKNNGPDELKNIKAVPRLEGEEGQWPFATDYQSYEEGKESMAPGRHGRPPSDLQPEGMPLRGGTGWSSTCPPQGPVGRTSAAAAPST